MKILKYKKTRNNEYLITTDKENYKLYDDIIIKNGLLLKKEVSEKEMQKIVNENNLLKAYYESLKFLSIKLRTEKEIATYLKKKEYNSKEIEYALDRLSRDGYLNHQIYIEAYIHDMLNLYLVGEAKIQKDLITLGFREEEIAPYLAKIEHNIYLDKINKYITKKLKANKKSENEFKRKTLNELINKGFNKNDVLSFLDKLEIPINEEEVKKIITRLALKYNRKYDLNTTKLKIRNYLYTKGYSNIDIDKYL